VAKGGFLGSESYRKRTLLTGRKSKNKLQGVVQTGIGGKNRRKNARGKEHTMVDLRPPTLGFVKGE